MEMVFNPDIEDISSLMTRVWTPPGWVYDVKTLDYYLGSKKNQVFSLGAYYEGNMVGYLAYLELPAYLGGAHQSIFSTFWTVDPESDLRGLGWALHKTMVTERVDLNDYDSYLTVVDANRTAQRSFSIIARRLAGNFTTYMRDIGWIYTTAEILSRHVKKVQHGNTEIVENVDPDSVCELIAKYGGQIPKSIFTTEVLEDMFDKRVARVTVMYKKNEENIGIMSGKIIKTVGAKIYPTLVVDLLVIDKMNEDEIGEFIPSIGVLLTNSGIEKIMIPSLGHFNEQSLLNAGFFRAKEKQTLCALSISKTKKMPEASDAIYLDVY
jgi:hypothetical protein